MIKRVETIYNCDVVLIDSKPELAKFCKKEGLDYDFVISEEKYAARTLSYDHGLVLIYFHQFDDSTLVHELFHATAYILARIGMKLSNKTAEAYAYLLEYLYKQFKR